MLLATEGAYQRISGSRGAPAVPHCAITVGSQRTGCSISHRFSSPAFPEIWLFVSPVSRFTVNKSAQMEGVGTGMCQPRATRLRSWVDTSVLTSDSFFLQAANTDEPSRATRAARMLAIGRSELQRGADGHFSGAVVWSGHNMRPSPFICAAINLGGERHPTRARSCRRSDLRREARLGGRPSSA